MGNKLIPPGGAGGPEGPDGIEQIDFREALEERYLAYALSTIMHRALPDVRDGMKPVHRRLLYAMRLLKLDPGQGFKKCARIVGDVMGKYHPHGDSAIYDALVRLAQEFSQRYPLAEGQGNFGNIDGDSAAAMRYTEARLTETARLLLDGIDEDAIDFRETYDGLDQEPVVLPGGFPNLLANGSAGIAVGMATSIPSHNVAEICDAALHLIKHPNAPTEKLVEFTKGPDFPTGGVLVEYPTSILEAYKTGRGGFRVQAKWEKEETGRGTWVVVITEIPYQVQKSKLIEKITELLMARKLPFLADIRDESAEDIRIVLEPRSRNVDEHLLMASLFKLTDLESRFPLNMNVLSRGQVPNVLGLRNVLSQWLEHRKEVLIRRSQHRLDKIEHRLEVLDGYLIAYLNLDEMIRIIRHEDEPKRELMKTFSLSEIQAEAILNMRLRSLRKLEEMEISGEHDKLAAERDELNALLASDDLQWKTISSEIRTVRKSYGPETEMGKRRTQFGEAEDIDLEGIHNTMIEREPITVVVSQKGWIRVMKGHIQDTSGLSFKQGDGLAFAFPAEMTDKLLVFSTGGRFFTLTPDKLPGGRSQGEPIRLMVDMDQDQDIVAVFVHKPGRKLLVAATDARGFVVSEDDIVANTRKGKQVLNVSADAEAKLCVPADGDRIAVIGTNRKLLVFPLEQVGEMTRGRGVRLQRYCDGGISDAVVFKAEEGLTWINSAGHSFTRTLEELSDWCGDRAQAGRLPPTGFPRSNKFGSNGLG